MRYRFACDCHNHSSCSPDGNDTVLEMRRRAQELGLWAHTLTDHCECQNWTGRYRPRVERAWEEMAAEYPPMGQAPQEAATRFYRGIELGQPNQDPQAAQEALQGRDYDFVIGSIHNIRGYEDFFFLDYSQVAPDFIDQLLTTYWEEELELNIPRNELGHRYYREEEIQLLNCIKELKNKGFQLKAVKEVLPDLEQKKLIDVHKLLATQVELENMEREEEEQERTTSSEEGEQEEEDEDARYNGKVVALRKEGGHAGAHPVQGASAAGTLRSNEEKMREFESIMGRIIGKALREQAEAMGDVMGDRISNRVIREMDEVLEEREEREEARYKKLDETIRNHQKARQEIAVTKEDGGRKKSRFFRKNKRKI